jgi:cobalt/nickel transport system permease protein
LHHVVLERWSRGSSSVHRIDPRAKIVALLVFLIVVATAHRHLAILSCGLFVLLSTALAWARLPVIAAVMRAGIVLPFTAVFVFISWWAGDPGRGFALLLKSYLSALAVMVVVSTTPLPALIRGMEMTRTPRFLLMVVQFLYRYLFVISEEAQHMVKAASSRGATSRGWIGGRSRFRAAAGALAVLFARSYGRAEDIHRAMLARGFEGHFRTLGVLRFRGADACFAAAASLAPILWRVAVERVR